MYLHAGKLESMIKKYEATNTFATIDSSKKMDLHLVQHLTNINKNNKK